MPLEALRILVPVIVASTDAGKRPAPTEPEGAPRAKRANQESLPTRPSLGVIVAGSTYQTLPWFLGRVPTKGEKSTASAFARHQLVELRNGDHNTLRRYNGKSIIPVNLVDDFKRNKWVSTVCVPTRADRWNLEAKLLVDNKAPSSSNFLWKTSELKKAFA